MANLESDLMTGEDKVREKAMCRVENLLGLTETHRAGRLKELCRVSDKAPNLIAMTHGLEDAAPQLTGRASGPQRVDPAVQAAIDRGHREAGGPPAMIPRVS